MNQEVDNAPVQSDNYFVSSLGTQLVMNSPVDQALLQLVQQEVKALQDGIDNMAVEFENEKAKSKMSYKSL